MKTKLTFLIIAAALAAATAGRAQTVISYSTDGGAQALETGSVRQTVLDTATLEVSYRMEWLRRPDSKEPMQDLLLLQAGGKVTKFFSYKTLQRDSLLRITPTEQVLANVGNFKGGLEAVVFQNYPAGEMTCTDKISRLHEGQRQQGADRAKRDISETILIHGRGVYTAKIRIKTLLPPALTLFNTS